MLSKAWRNSQSKAVCVITVARAEKCERKIRINFESPRRNFDVGYHKEFWIILCFLPSFYLFSGFWVFPFLCYSFKYHFDAGFSVLFLLISRIYHVFVRILFVPFYFVYFCIEQVIVVLKCLAVRVRTSRPIV